MPARNRRTIVLVLLLGVLALVVLFQVRRGFAPATAAAAATPAPRAGAKSQEKPVPSVVVPAVRLDALNQAADEPGAIARDPFRLRPKAPPPMPTGQPGGTSFGRAGAPGVPGAPAAPAGPPPPPPIRLKFIGLVEVGATGTRMAVLSDDRGVYYGKDGDVIDGRYRLVRVTRETIEVSYLDGSGQTRIRLQGS